MLEARARSRPELSHRYTNFQEILAMNSLRTVIRATLGVAAAATLPASGAWALSPTLVNALTSNNIIYVSGSTATDKALQAWASLSPSTDASAPFAAGTYDLYKTATGYVLTGTATSIFGPTISGQNIAIVKQTQGGSATGIHNVAEQISPPDLSFPDLSTPSSLTATCAAGVNTPAKSPFQSYDTYTCTLVESQGIQPNAGISDEDPTTWIGTGGVTSSDAGALTATHAVEVPFAAMVSLPLRNALQSAEGLTSGSDTLANVPSLSPAQLRAIMSGQMTSLGDLYVFNPTTQKTTQVDTTDSTIHICRRGNTSGTEFADNIYLFGSGCSKGSGVGSVALPDVASSATAGVAWAAADGTEFVFAGAGTGDVLNCVSAPLASGVTVNYRIGVVSTDQVPSTTQVWRYVAINGVAPTIWNIQLGSYDWLTEDSFNYTATSIALNGGAGNHLGIFTTVNSFLSDVTGLAGLNANSQNAAAPADTSGGAADTGIVTIPNSVLYGSSDTTGPSAPAWPAAIRAIATAGQGPNSPLSKTYPSENTNNCNGAYQSDPTG